MSQDNGSGPTLEEVGSQDFSDDAWWEDMTARANKRRAELQVKRARFKQGLDAVDHELRRIDRLVKGAAKPKPRRTKKSHPSVIGPIRLQATAEAARSLGKPTFTADEVHAAGFPGQPEATTKKALNQLRKEQVLVKIGTVPGTRTTLYSFEDEALAAATRERS